MDSNVDVQFIVEQVDALPIADRLALVEIITQHIRKDLARKPKLNLKGILAGEGAPPTDEEIRKDYIDYLDEKYR